MTLFKCLATALLALTLSACGADAPDTAPASVEAIEVLQGDNLWDVDGSASTITFTGTQEGEAFEGRFTEFDIQIDLDPEAPETGSILAVIDLTSVETGDPERDDALPTSDWFDVRRHPQAVYRSDEIVRSFSRAGEPTNLYTAIGTLTLKGIELPVRLGFRLVPEGAATRANGRVTLNRQQFGVGSGAYDTDQWIAFPVDVELDILATLR